MFITYPDVHYLSRYSRPSTYARAEMRTPQPTYPTKPGPGAAPSSAQASNSTMQGHRAKPGHRMRPPYRAKPGSAPGPAHRRLRQHLTFLNNVARNLIWSDSSNATKPHDSNDVISNPEIHAGELRATLETRPRNRQHARHGHTSG